MQDVSSAELAAWVQAVGSIAAIVITMGVAIWQARQQHRTAMTLIRAEREHAALDASQTLLVIARNCSRAAQHLSQEVGSREALYLVARGEKHFDFQELDALKDAVSQLPLHQLPHDLISPAMALGATFRQIHWIISTAVERQRDWDSAKFSEYLARLKALNDSLVDTVVDVDIVVSRRRNGSGRPN